jgi:hypothetical protein
MSNATRSAPTLPARRRLNTAFSRTSGGAVAHSGALCEFCGNPNWVTSLVRHLSAGSGRPNQALQPLVHQSAV